MSNKFLSKKITILAAILFGGLLIAFSILMSASFTGVKLSVVSPSSQWTQGVGVGVAVPACAGSNASVTCTSGVPDIRIAFEPTCEYATSYFMHLFISGTLGDFSQGYVGNDPSGERIFLSCGGIFEWSANQPRNVTGAPGGTIAPPQSNKTYAVRIRDSGERLHTEFSFTTPNCAPPPGDFNLSLNGSAACNSVPLSWTASSGATAYRILRGSPLVDISPYQPYTALNFTDTTVSQNTTHPYQIEAYNAYGTNRSNTISVSTPYCSPTLSFSGSPTSIFQGQSTTLTWSSANVTSCTASGSWSGGKALSGSEIVFPSPPPSATFNLTCSGPGGSASASVTVSITPLALPDWREIIPR